MYSSSLPPQDAVLQMNFALPASALVPRSLRMRTKGRVLRVEPARPGTSRGGFAVAYRSLSLRRGRSKLKQIA